MNDKQLGPLHHADVSLIQRDIAWHIQANDLLRTQHAAIERKDALLRQSREVLKEIRVNSADYDFGPAYEGTKRRQYEVLIAIKQELAK